jgi:hypothetical protein
MKIPSLTQCVATVGAGSLILAKGAQAAPAIDKYEMAARRDAPRPGAAPAVRNDLSALAPRDNGAVTTDRTMPLRFYAGCFTAHMPEYIAGEQDVHSVSKTRDDGTTTTFTLHETIHGSATGLTSGTKYQFNREIQQVINKDDPVTFGYANTYDFSSDIVLTEQGSGLIEHATLESSYTYDHTAGVFTSSHTITDADCGK